MDIRKTATALAALLPLATGAAQATEITLPAGYTAAYGAVYNPATDTSYVAIAADSQSVTFSDAWLAINDIAAQGGPQGWLATIYSAQENSAIANGFAARGLDLWGYRIGAVRGNTRDAFGAIIPDYSGGWFWNGNTSEPMGYANWAPGDPDNLWGNQFTARFQHDGQWDDTSADAGFDALNNVHYNLGFVAEFAGNVSVSAVPEPGSYALMLAGIAAVGCIARRRSGR
ncbi:C-type lectin domain-containing protein [Pelomonas sp. KK5]|uniref:C-type lectin domain-containing protein n=1 Tax=Pelomonas sp. KK5 TaxID=1855730 RepID=UPI00097C5193|nr:C-type lectin domain-containing protein [Pelomonas sp. KK5]